MRIFAIVPLFAMSFLTVQERSCERVYRFAAPDGRSAVVLREIGNFGDGNFELTLTEDGAPDITLAPVKRDCWLDFAHAAWIEDSRKVAVYFGDGLCGDTWVSYDRDRRKFLRFDAMADAMRESIRETYQLSPEDLRPFWDDPLQWARAAGKRGSSAPDPAREAFQRLMVQPLQP